VLFLGSYFLRELLPPTHTLVNEPDRMLGVSTDGFDTPTSRIDSMTALAVSRPKTMMKTLFTTRVVPA
jgi:hypothetical protein